MSALAVIAALAAQATVPSGSAATETPAGDGPRVGSRSYVDLDAGAGYSSSPTLTSGGSSGAGFGRFSITGVHTRISARTTTALSGYAQTSFYTRSGSTQSIDLNARHDALVSERLQVSVNGDFARDEGGQLDTRIISLPDVPLPSGAAQPPVLISSGGDFLSVAGRQYRAIANASAQLALSSKDSLSTNTGIYYLRSKSAGFSSHYTTIPVSVGYSRKLSPRTSIGVRLAAERTEYNGPASSRTFSPQLTIQTLLSQYTNLSGAIGVSFSSSDDGLVRRRSTGLSADASLCSAGDRDRYCARAAVNQQAATAAGPANSISVGINYSRKLSENESLNFAVDANRYSSPALLVTGPSFSRATYVRGSVGYSRKVGRRWFGGADLSARKITQTGPDRKADVTASVFIRYRLGDLQ